jgi:bifunctional DNA-binding transcriptional regulator/antitoxin component of YhaV-PrlF toxin-antitoxin module
MPPASDSARYRAPAAMCGMDRAVCYTADRMTVSVKKDGLSVPRTVTRKAGIKPGDLVEFTVRQGTITIQPAAKIDESRYSPYTPTKAEAAAIRRGRSAYKRGDYVTLDQLHSELDADRRRSRKKITRKAS